jgi:hypothetical protein
VNVQPRQTMRCVQNVVYANANVTIVHLASGGGSGSATPSRFIPCKNARVNVIINQFTKPSLGKIFGVHGFNYIKQAGYCQT